MCSSDYQCHAVLHSNVHPGDTRPLQGEWLLWSWLNYWDNYFVATHAVFTLSALLLVAGTVLYHNSGEEVFSRTLS